MKTIRDIIASAMAQALQDLGVEVPELIHLEHPKNENHGDYSSNVAMTTFSSLKSGKQPYKNPRELASAIVSEIKKDIPEEIKAIQVDGPGFINFHLSSQYLVDRLGEILSQKDRYGQNLSLRGMKVIVEYTDPNPFKEFHIGHLYSNIVGESVAKLKEASGAEVWRGDFFGDVGMHVAKSIWGLVGKLAEDEITLEMVAKWDLKKRIEYLGKAYAKGATAYKESETAKKEMQQLNFLIFKAAQEIVLPEYDKEPEIDFDQFIKPSKYDYEEIKEIYRLGREWSLQYFETIYARLGTKFDGYYPESLTGEYGYAMVMEGLDKGIFERGEGGAIIFPGEKYGLHNRVFINSLGLPTYEAKDFGNAVAKHEDFAYDQSVIVTGNEIVTYFHVVLEALRLYRPELGLKTVHIGHGMVRLPEGKMSSRTGKILRGEWLLDEAKKLVLEILKRSKSIPEAKQDEVAEVVGQGAVKYALLKQSIGENIAFEFSTSISFEGNSGPYLQYTYVRCKSVMRKSQKARVKVKIEPELINSRTLQNFSEEEFKVINWLSRFSEVVNQAAAGHEIHQLCNYLYELAQRYNAFYNSHSILGSESKPVNEMQKQSRLLLTAATAQVLKNGLSLLGIKTPEQM